MTVSNEYDALRRELLRRGRSALERLEAALGADGAAEPGAAAAAARDVLFRRVLRLLRGSDGGLLPRPVAPGHSLSNEVLADALAPLVGAPGDPFAARLGGQSVDVLGDLYEALAVDAGAAPGRRALTGRRRAGAWYTPPAVVGDMVRRALSGLRPPDDATAWAAVRVLDPAVGSGRFLVAAARQLAVLRGGSAAPGDPVLADVLARQLVGVDADPFALRLTALLLAELLAGRDRPLCAPDTALVQGDALLLLAPRRDLDAPAAAPPALTAGFDLVVGNPPYGVVPTAGERAALRARYPLHRGAFDRYRLFLEAALGALAPGGRAALLLPTTWLTLRHAAALRAHVLAGFNVREVTRLDWDVFPGAHVAVAAVLIERSAPDERPIALRHAASPAALAAGAVPLDHVPPRAVLGARHALARGGDARAPGLRALAARLAAAHPPAGALARFVCGLKPYQRGKGRPPQTGLEARERAFETTGPVDASCRPLLVGRHVLPFALAWEPHSWLRYGPWLAEPRAPEVFAAPLKLVGRQTGDRIIVAPDEAQRVARDSTWLGLASAGAEPAAARRTLLWLLAVLNDPIATFLFRVGDPDEADKTFPQVRVGSVAALPVPDPAAVAPAVLDGVLALVAARMRCAAGPARDAGRAAALEAALHALLTRAWGLTPGEAAALRTDAGCAGPPRRGSLPAGPHVG